MLMCLGTSHFLFSFMAAAALLSLLKAVASGSVTPEKAAELIASNKGKELSADQLDKIAGGNTTLHWS